MTDTHEEQWTEIGCAGRDSYRVNKTTVDMTRTRNTPRPVKTRALPQEIVFDLDKSAFVIIDMQNDFCAEGGTVHRRRGNVRGAEALFAPINRLTSALRSKDVPIVWVNWGVRPDRLNLSPGVQRGFNKDGRGPGLGGLIEGPRSATHRILEKGSWGAAIADALVTEPSDVFVDKHRISGFWDTPLDSILRNLAVRTLFFAGVNTDQCVYATLLDASCAGYDTILVEDCAATTSPGFCTEAVLYNVRNGSGFTLRSDDLLAAL